jgi:signal transduction histidine kinase
MPVVSTAAGAGLARQSLLIAGLCLLADTGAYLLIAPVTTAPTGAWVVLAGLVLADAALGLPTRFAAVAAVAHVAVTLLSVAVGPAVGVPSPIGFSIAGYRAGAWLRGAAAAAALLALIAGVLVGEHLGSGIGDGRMLAINVLIGVMVPWLVGRHTTTRRAHLADLERHAENERRDVHARVARAVVDERRAIARDLHDVISHHVSAVGVHAGAARLSLAAGSPDRLRDSLSAVETATRSAMGDLRRMLALLHGQDSDGIRQPGMHNLDDLLDGTRAAGLDVRLHVTGASRDLPESLDLAVYRITQEMLTNALRHGDGDAVDIRLDYAPDTLTLSSRNTRPAVPAGARAGRTRRGISGIERRAALFDGTVTYGPHAGGRTWQTVVELPLADHP